MSKFNYPNRLYARSQNNKTIDMSYAPQDMNAVEYIKSDAVLDWLEEQIQEVSKGKTSEVEVGMFKAYNSVVSKINTL